MDKQSLFLILLIIILSGFAFWAFFGTYIGKRDISGSNKILKNQNIATISVPAIPNNKKLVLQLFKINNLTNFAYPGAKIITEEQNTIILKSSDSPEAITNWYKVKITNSKMMIETFIKTKSNETISNKIIAKSIDKQLVINITKNESESETTIIASTLNGLND